MLLELFLASSRGVLRGLGARREIVEIEGYRVVTWTLGPEGGEPWLLLHGLGSTAVSWAPVLRALRRECRCVVPELSALGGTAGPTAGLDVGTGARVAAALAERLLPGRRPTVAGLSLGGWMAVRLGLERPELPARLLIIDGGGYLDQDWERIERTVRVDSTAGVERLYDALFVRTPWTLRACKRTFLRAYGSTAVREVLDALDASDAFDDEALASLRVPTGLIWAEGDGLFRLEAGEAMARALPCSRLWTVPACGHAIQWERPGGLVERLRTFRSTFGEAG